MENLQTKNLLTTAIELVGGDRQQDYGDKVENHHNIASLWNSYLDNKLDMSNPITPHDVAIMMCLLKIARTKLGKVSPDTYIDASAYMAFAGECKSNED